MADPRFHYRSDSLTPRRVSVPTASKVFTTPSGTTPSLLTKTTEVGCIGSTYLDINSNGLGYYRAIRFVGYGNVDSMSSGLSVLCRVIPRFTGFNPSSYGGLFTLNGFANTPYIFLRALTNGAFQFTCINADFAQIFNAVSSSTHSFTSGTAVDIVVTWTGTNATNGVKIYINGNLLFQTTASANSNYSDAKGQFFESIIAGSAWPQGELGGFDLNEMAVWGEVIDPTSGGLNLNGSSRSSFVTSVAETALAVLPTVGEVKSGVAFGVSSALIGTRTSPAVGNVRSGAQFGAAGTEFTGTAVIPSLANTKIGVSGDGGTGTYDGTDRHTDPGVSNVKGGVSYKSNSTLNNRTGTLVSYFPSPGLVLEGTDYTIESVDYVGSYVVPTSTNPGVENVALDVGYIIDDVPYVGELFLGAFYDTLRGFLNYILEFIGSTSLTNDEFDPIVLVNPEFEYNLETYQALVAVLDSREDISDARDRLKSMFESAGVVTEEPVIEDTDSDIIMGGGVEDADSTTEGYTNVLFGGSVDD